MAIGILIILIAVLAFLQLFGMFGTFADNTALNVIAILIEIAGILTLRVWYETHVKRKTRK
jgi:hypothetical protein